ncbi:cytochrome P450 [Tanacetum coccineum]
MESLKIPIDNELFTIRVQESDDNIDSLFNGYFFLSDDSHTSSAEPNNKNQTWFDDGTDSSEDNSDDDHGGGNNGHETGGDFIPETFSNAIPFMEGTGGDRNMAKSTVGCSEEGLSSPIGYEVNNNNLSSMSDKAAGKDTYATHVKILSKPCSSVSLSSNEVDRIVHLGNEIGFDMRDKDIVVADVLAQGEFKGGIIAIWDTVWFTMLNVMEGDGYLAVSGTWRPLDSPCIIIIIIYAPQCLQKKKHLWFTINNLITHHNSLSIVFCDFNEVRNESERMGTIFCRRGASLFNKFISDCGLTDLPLGGMRFTRMNNQGSKLSKLDRFLVSHQFLDNWPSSHVLALVREFSDHSPIILQNYIFDYGPVPFKFYNTWLLNKDFESILCNSWSSSGSWVGFSKATVFKKKLQLLKSNLKDWRKLVNSLECASATSLREKISLIDIKAEIGPLTSDEVMTRAMSVKELANLEYSKAKDLRQKSKSK